MPVIPPVPADVKPVGSTVRLKKGVAGETLSQGDACYLLENKWMKADNSTSAKADFKIIAMSQALVDEEFTYVEEGEVDLGASFTEDEVYVLSSTSGQFEPIADLSSNDYITIAGIGNASNNLILKPWATGKQHA